MTNNKRGKQSFVPEHAPTITAWASVAGKKESEGPLKHTFDVIEKDAYFGQKTWEQGEKRMQQIALETLAHKAGISKQDLGLVFSGDLLNQCIGSSFTLRNMGIPHLGLYGACSTMAESLLMATMAVGNVVGQKIAGAMNTAMNGMNPSTVPPPVPVVAYHVAINGQAAGPYDLAALKQMAVTGQFAAASLVWKAGMAEWVKAEAVDELREVLANIIPPMPPVV